MKNYPRLDDHCLYIIDIGASGGIHPRFKKINNPIRAILFEPDPREFDKLKSAAPNNYIVLNTALSEFTEEINFNLCKKQQVSSVYLPNWSILNNFPDPDRFTITKTVKMTADSLDNQLDKCGILDIDFIKVDAEGYELSILKGANDILNNVVGLESEVSFASIRENQPLFHDVNKYVTQLGFQLLDIKGYYWRRRDTNFYGNIKGQIVVGDAIYFRSPESICDRPGIDERKIVASFLLFIAYGYFDIGERLYILAKQRNIITEEVGKEIDSLLTKYRRRIWLTNFRGKQRIHNILMRIANLFCSNTWYHVDRELGN